MDVRDPGAVAVRSGVGHEAQIVLPERGPPEKVSLARGEISTSADRAAHYELDGVREADGAIRLEWDVRVPLPLGERVTLLPQSGSLHLVLPEGPLPVSWPSSGTVRVALCAQLSPHSNRGSVSYGTSVIPTVSCSPMPGSASVPLELETISETTRLSHHDRPDRAVAGLLLAVDILVFGTVGGPLVGVGEGANSKPLVVGGASVLAVGGAFALLLAPTFFASRHDQLLLAPGR